MTSKLFHSVFAIGAIATRLRTHSRRNTRLRADCLALLLLLVNILNSGCREPISQPHREASAAQNKVVSLSFEGETLVINGTKVAFPSTVEAVSEVLGAPDRIVGLANRILVWDDLGIYAYQNDEASPIFSVVAEFKREGFQFSPRSSFPGRVALPNINISSQTTHEELKAIGFDEKNAEYNSPGTGFPSIEVGRCTIIATIGEGRVRSVSWDWDDDAD